MISDFILIAKKFSVPSAYGRRDGVRDFFAQYPDGVYIATDSGAPAGWEGYAVWFGGTGERYAERFMELIRDGYIVERFLRARVGGLLVFTFRCRLKMRRFGTLGKPNGGSEPGPSPIDEWWGLKLMMPEGGTVILRKNGAPNDVSLEVSTDAVNWSAWELVGTDYTYTLQAGETLCIRNTSTTFVRLSTGISNYYKFVFDNNVEASGSVMSLSVNDETVLSLSWANYNFTQLFKNCTSLVTAPILSATTLSPYCYFSLFENCTSLVTAPILPATTLSVSCYYSLFRNCTSLTEIRTYMTNISASNCLLGWLYGTSASGDFYCPSELTIPTGANGIPSGWTRHDI